VAARVGHETPRPEPQPPAAAPCTVGEAFAAEWGRVLGIRGAFSILILAPLIYGLYYPQPYLGQILRKIPIAVVDEDLSDLSQSIVQNLEASGAVSVAVRANSLAEAHATLQAGRAFAVVGIPPGTERDVLKGMAAHVPIYADATYLFVSAQPPMASRSRSTPSRPNWQQGAHDRMAASSRRLSLPPAQPIRCCSQSSIRSAAMRATLSRPLSC
jgi:hypothetical protein